MAGEHRATSPSSAQRKKQNMTSLLARALLLLQYLPCLTAEPRQPCTISRSHSEKGHPFSARLEHPLTLAAAPPEAVPGAIRGHDPLESKSSAALEEDPLHPGRCLCCNDTEDGLSFTAEGTVVVVTGATERLNLTWLAARCPAMTSLTARVGATEVTGDGTDLTRLSQLDLSGNRLTGVPESVLELSGLASLDIANNRFKSLPQLALKPLFDKLTTVDISGNPLLCSRGLAWLAEVDSIQNWDRLTCVGARPGPFGNDLKPLKEVIKEIQRTADTCPAGCRCQLQNLQPTQLTADCSGGRLRHLPRSLPADVTTLNVSGNQIREASLCRLTKAYASLSILDLSHNQLEDLPPADLTCSGQLGWLYLRHNRLQRLSWTDLRQALLRNLNFVYLAHNPWDCQYEQAAMQFWRFLVGHHKAVPDFREVFCADTGGVHAGKQVLLLLAGEENVWHRPLLSPLDSIILAESLLLIMMAAQVTWDVYWYHRTARLPWILTCWQR